MKTLHTFNLDVETPYKHYKGAFTIRKLTINDLSAVGVRKIQLNGGFHYDPDRPGQGVDPSTNELNSVIAHLEHAVVESPDWWDLDEIADMRVVNAVYREVLDFEATFLGFGEELAKLNARGSSKTDRPKKTKRTNTNRPSKKVVDEEVQSSLEP